MQIKCTNDPDKPVDLQLWGGDEFTVFTDPEDPRQAFAVVTIDRYNQRTRYKLWFEDEVRTFLTDQYSADKTAGARVAMADPGRGRRTPMAASPSRSCTIVLRFDSSGRLDLERSCVKLNSGLTIDLASWMSLSSSMAGLSASSRTSILLFTPEIGPGRFLRLTEAALATPETATPTAASPPPSTSRPS